MAGVRKKPTKSGKYQGWFVDAAGKQRFFTGTRSKTATQHLAERLEDEHRQVRLGYRPAPQAADKQRHRSVEEVKGEYVAWGESQGGDVRGSRGRFGIRTSAVRTCSGGRIAGGWQRWRI